MEPLIKNEKIMRKPRRHIAFKIRADLYFIRSIRGIQDHHLEKRKDKNVINFKLNCFFTEKVHMNPCYKIRKGNSLQVKAKTKEDLHFLNFLTNTGVNKGNIYTSTIITISNQNNFSVSTSAKPGISKMVEITYQKTELIRNGFLFHQTKGNLVSSFKQAWLI